MNSGIATTAHEVAVDLVAFSPLGRYHITVPWGAAAPPFTSRPWRRLQTFVLPRLPASEPIVFAHRGAHGPDRAQNSLCAIERALEIGAPGVEIDVCSLRDGEVVVGHDDWVLSGSRKLPLAELLLTDCRIYTGQVLRIESALDLFSGADTIVCLDWKRTGDIYPRREAGAAVRPLWQDDC